MKAKTDRPYYDIVKIVAFLNSVIDIHAAIHGWICPPKQNMHPNQTVVILLGGRELVIQTLPSSHCRTCEYDLYHLSISFYYCQASQPLSTNSNKSS